MFKLVCRGGEDLARALRALPGALTRKVVIEALKDAGAPIASAMGALAPRSHDSAAAQAQAHTGYESIEHLADSMRVQSLTPTRVARAGRDPDTDFAVEIGPTRAHFYGFFREHGTVHSSAQPFARPAFDAGHQPALGTIGRRLWDAIAKRAKGRYAPSAGGRFL